MYRIGLLCAGLLLGLCRPAPAQDFSFLGKTADQWRQQLAAPDAPARARAAFALGRLGLAASGEVPGLLDALRDDRDPAVREAAAFALGEVARQSFTVRGTPGLLDALRRALREDGDPLVRRSAAYALGCLERAAVNALEDLDRAVQDDDPAVRQNVAWALGRIGPAGVSSLRKLLADGDPLVLRDAAVALGELDKDARPAIPALLPHVSDKQIGVRRAVLAALVKLVEPADAGTAAGPLTRALGDRDPESQFNAALALGNIGGDAAAAAVPVLAGKIQRGKIEARRQAAAVLQNIGPPVRSALGLLRETLDDPDEELQFNAAVAIASIGPDAEPAVPQLVDLIADRQAPGKARQAAGMALLRIGPCPAAVAAIPRITGVVTDRDSDTEVRVKALWALRTHNQALGEHRDVFTALEQVLREPRPAKGNLLHYDCAYILGLFQRERVSKSAMDTLSDFLDDDTIRIFKGVRAEASGGTGEKRPGSAEVRADNAGDARVMAIQALKAIGRQRIRERPEMLRKLERIADDPTIDPDLRTKTKELLSVVQ